MESKLRSLFHDPDYYVKCFKIYAVLSDKYSVLTKWGETVFGEAVVAKLQPKLDGQEELRVFGVGSGSGEMDFKMLTKLLQRFPRINNRVVEPAWQQIVQYKALVQTKAHELHGVSCDWQQQTIDQYEKAGDLMKFHFISAIQSIYYADDVDSSLMYLYNRLEPGGVLLVITISDDSGYWQLWKHFPSFQDNLMKFLSSADIRRTWDHRSIPYSQYHQPSYVDITQCFDETSEDGRMLVDILIHVEKFKEMASEDLHREVMDYLASSDCSEKKSDGQVLFNNHWDAIVVSKPLK